MLSRKRKLDQREGDANTETKAPLLLLGDSDDIQEASLNCPFDLEADQVVTVETSIFDETGSNLIHQYSQIHLLSHCVFCRRKTAENEDIPTKSPPIQQDLKINSSELSENVSRAYVLDSSSSPSPQQFLSTFNSVWMYLGRSKETQEDSLDFIMEGGSKTLMRDVKRRTTFIDLPRMCVCCAGKLNAIHGLFTQLKTQLNAIGEIMAETKQGGKYSWRGEQFERILTSSRLELDVIAATINIFEELGAGHVMEDTQYEGLRDNLTLNSKSLPNRGLETSFSEFENFDSDLAASEDAVAAPMSTQLFEAESCDAAETRYDASSSSTYIEVPSAVNDNSENFVDEDDDDWSDKDNSDPDYIKSEPDSDDDDFSESEDTLAESESDEEWKGNLKSRTDEFRGYQNASRTFGEEIEMTKDCEPSTGKNMEKGTQSRSKYWQSNHRQQLEQSGALVISLEVQTDADTRVEKFLCKIDNCGRTYSSWNAFYEHERKAHRVQGRKPRNNPCDLCGKKYKGLALLQIHKQSKHGIKIIKEPKLSRRQRFEQSGALVVQVDPQTGVEKFLCKIGDCGKTYKGWTSFYDHEMTQHGGAQGRGSGKNYGDNSCDQCNKHFFRLRSLQRHKRAVHDKKLVRPHKCDLCHQIIAAGSIYEHVRNHVGEDYLTSCPNPECLHVYTKSSSLCRHLRENDGCRESIPNAEEFLESVKCKSTKCEICGEQRKNVSSLRIHLDNVHEKRTKNFSCPVTGCSRQFTVRQSVALHIGQHRGPPLTEKQKCDLCSVKIKTEQMENHLKESHGVGADAVIKCNICPFLFSTRENLLDHLFEHKTVLTCDMCGDDQVKFARHVQLREHYLNCHNIGAKFQCEYCEKVYSARYLLVRHVSVNHSRGKGTNQSDTLLNIPDKPEKRYKCGICDAAYTQHSSLRDHKIKFHEGEHYKCSKCTETFVNWKLYCQHEREHIGIPTAARPPLEKNFKCEVDGCGNAYTSNAKLRQHVSAAHQKLKPYFCELCGKSYAASSGLKSHNKIAHLGVRYPCDVCNDTFTNSSTLKRHKLIHTGDRPFVCEICGQRFRHKEVLKTHVEGHQRKGADFKPNGPMKQIRKRVEKKS